MSLSVGINGFGRIGRLLVRASQAENSATHQYKFVRINDPAGSPATLAHLLEFDSVHGRWGKSVKSNASSMGFDDTELKCTQESSIENSDWSQCDVVIDASGKFKTVAALQPYFAQGVKKVIVCAPVKEPGALNIVMGVNDQLYDPAQHSIVTAASCTTNCLAPAVKVINEQIGIKHGSITTVHSITNTQSILDQPHKDLRRARACGSSLIPTTTGSATAIAEIFPELRGKLNGHAIRVPLANASLTDCVFELNRTTSRDEVNTLLKQASDTYLSGILGYEDRPLVSVDYRTDPRSSIVDGLSTMVVNDTQLKLYLWYDNEWGYANRVSDLLNKVISMGV